MQFEVLQIKKHNRKNFDCGVDALNFYLQQYANQDQTRNLCKIYVLADNTTIIGYYSLSSHSVARDNLPATLKVGSYSDIPFLLLGRLAVDKQYQGQGYGDILIVDAFHRTTEVAKQIGILGMIVDAKDEKTITFYEKFGFQRLNGTQNRLLLPLTAMDGLLN